MIDEGPCEYSVEEKDGLVDRACRKAAALLRASALKRVRKGFLFQKMDSIGLT